MEKVRGLQNLAYQLGLDEGRVLGLLFFAETYFFSETDHLKSELLFAGRFWAISCLDLYVLVCQFGLQEFHSLQQVGNVLTLVLTCRETTATLGEGTDTRYNTKY